MILFGPVNTAVFDLPWSAVHAASGLGLGLGFFMMRSRLSNYTRVTIGVGILVVWEIIEGTAGRLGLMASETFANVIGDLVIGAAGIFVGWVLVQRHRRVFRS